MPSPPPHQGGGLPDHLDTSTDEPFSSPSPPKVEEVEEQTRKEKTQGRKEEQAVVERKRKEEETAANGALSSSSSSRGQGVFYASSRPKEESSPDGEFVENSQGQSEPWFR